MYTVSRFKKLQVIKTAWHRHTDLWNTIKNPEMDPHRHAQLILTKVEKKQFNGGRVGFATNGAGAIGNPQAKRETLT